MATHSKFSKVINMWYIYHTKIYSEQSVHDIEKLKNFMCVHIAFTYHLKLSL